MRSSFIRRRAPSRPRSSTTSTCVPGSSTWSGMYARADHSSPPILTRPPCRRPAAARPRARPRAPQCRCASPPACAGARARAAAGRRATRASRRRRRRAAARPPHLRAQTIAAATAASATGPRKKRPGVKISPIASSNAAIAQTSHAATATHSITPAELGEIVDARLVVAGETEPVDEDGAACRSRARRRCRRRPCRRPSPRPRARRRAASSTARKIDACGFVFPWWNELMPASTSSAWWRANSRTSRAEFETRPIFSPRSRSSSSAGSDVVVELEVLVPLPAARELDVRRRATPARPAHAEDDPLGEGNPDLLVVVELGMPLQVEERGVARLLVARRVERQSVARRRS